MYLKLRKRFCLSEALEVELESFGDATFKEAAIAMFKQVV